MLSEALTTILIHQGRLLRRHSSSNGCLSSQHSVTFPEIIWSPKCVNVLEIWVFHGGKGTVMARKGIRDAARGSSTTILISISRKVTNTQATMDACYYNTLSHFPGLNLFTQFANLLEIWEFLWWKWYCDNRNGDRRCCQKLLQPFLYIKEG